MKNFVLSILCFVPLVSCIDAGTFRIEGKIDPAFEGCRIVLSDYDDEYYSDTTVVKNGRFRFEGAIDTTFLFDMDVVKKSEDERDVWARVALEAGKISVHMTADESKVGGTPLNDLWQSFSDKYRTADTDSIISFVIANNSNMVGRAAFFSSYQSFSEQNIHHILGETPAAFQEDEKVQMGIQANRLVRRLMMENEQRAGSLNVKYRDFELETPDGGTKRISDYVGKSKYLLIDFWATWCGPCIAGMPEMKTLYEKYRDKGVEMIGISLDVDEMRDYWRQVQAKIDTPWPQLGYLKGTDSDLAKAFIVSDIPYVVIIDEAGTIVRYVRMPAWESNLERVLQELIPSR